MSSAPARIAAEPRESEVAAPRARILLAEDQLPVRRALARTLRRRGMDVDEAGDGIAAIRLASQTVPDLAIIDLGLPDLDGFAVIEQLKSVHGASLPVIVLSGTDDAASRLRAFDCGADDFVAKPVFIPELLKRIDAFERARTAYVETLQARQQADHLRLYAGEAAALLAHDLNNGLCTALGNLTYTAETTTLDDEPREALAAATRAVQRMAALVRNFVDISRLEDAALVPQCADVDIGKLIVDTVAIHRPVAQHRNVRLVHECPPGLVAHVDSCLFERVLHNLVGNAMRYVHRRGTIAVRARDDEDELVVQVSNMGPKVPPHVAANLFEKYRSGTDQRACRGMGLYFCRLAIEAHGGTIRLAPMDEFDVNFSIRLPRG